MRITYTLAFCLLAVGCGNNNGAADMAAPDMAVPDMTAPRDLFTQDFAGVSCGNAYCDTMSQECCAMFTGQAVNAMCVPKGSCNTDAGAALQCDGPEDCPPVASPGGGCGAVIMGSIGNGDGGAASGAGSSSCVTMGAGTVSFNMDTGAFTVKTKLCHHKADCAGYTGMVPQLGNVKYDSCCSSAMVPGYDFCAPAIAATAIMGLNCGIN